MKKTIRQSVTLKASPRTVYELLMSSRKHAKFTGAAARIGRKVGGRFTAYDGYITGRNLELRPARKIVQSWHATNWPEGLDSTVTFALKPVKSGTRLTFTHRGVPAKEWSSLKKGWIEFYWKKMKAVLG